MPVLHHRDSPTRLTRDLPQVNSMPPNCKRASGPGAIRKVRSHLPHDPKRAMELLPLVICDETRRGLATVIANVWSRQDINAAWNAVTHAELNVADKQVMFNELWS